MKGNVNQHQFSLFDETPHKAAPEHSKPSGGSLDGGRTHEEHLPFDSGHSHADHKMSYHTEGVDHDRTYHVKCQTCGHSASGTPRDVHSAAQEHTGHAEEGLSPKAAANRRAHMEAHPGAVSYVDERKGKK